MIVYCYSKCSTCKKALKWLDERGIAYESRDLKEAPPTAETLKGYLALSDRPIQSFFNSSGQSYRDGNFKERLKEMTENEKLEALAADGMLIKRPLLVTSEKTLTGFREKEWVALLAP